MHFEGVDVRIDDPVDSGGISEFRFVDHIEDYLHTNFG